VYCKIIYSRAIEVCVTMQTITYSYNYGNVSPTVNIKYQQDIKKHVKKVSAATVTTSIFLFYPIIEKHYRKCNHR